MVGVSEEDLKQKENAQLNFTAEHNKEKTGFYLVVLLLVEKLDNFRATLRDIFVGKTIGFPS